METMFRYELAAARPGLYAAGADEVGRGPMAGPLCAAATSFAALPWIPGLRDSKKLSHEERQAMVPWIKAKATAWHITTVSVQELNEPDSNIQTLSLEAMKNSLMALELPLAMAFIDGNHLISDFAYPQKAIIKGDDNSLSIAAGSVLAKVYRDNIMDTIDVQYPEYGFAEHKGYCTKQHQAALAQYGPCEQHRLKYRNVRAITSAFVQGELDF